MDFSRTVICILTGALILSVLMAKLLNIIATDQLLFDENGEKVVNYTNYLQKKYDQLTDTPDNLIWFLQISDLHISIFRDSGRITQFQQFCDITVKKVKPLIVLATGDLTDAKTKDNLGSSQVLKEWIYYYNIITESEVTKDTVWLDIRGNHDNFNIKTINAKENYYRNYSVQGATHLRSYVHFEKKNGVNVAFLGVDACPEPGLKRPFNFVGILDHEQQQHIQNLKLEAEMKADHVIWFAHYPTSCILTPDNNFQRLDLRNLIGSSPISQVYLCGHLHTMGGFVPHMYTKQKSGYLELELGDWKDNRMFRLAALDHGLFSFVDQKHNTWPLVLVTNPKDARYAIPGREPLKLMSDSTHVRILAFSDVEIETVKISHDKSSWVKCSHIEGPLYACHWLPHFYRFGLHYLYVNVLDVAGKTASVTHPYSLDGTPVNFGLKARILLMLNAGSVFQGIFLTILVLNVLPLLLLRFHKTPPKYHRRFGRRVLRRIWLLCKIDKIFYPLIIYSFYLPFGPWAVGYLIDDNVGAVFAWGIIIKSSYLPEPFTYMYGSVQMVFVQIPLIFVLAYTLDQRLFGNHHRGFKKIVTNIPFILLISIQLLLIYFFWLEYGTMALLFGPLRTWSVILSSTLWYKILTLPPEQCRKIANLNDLPS